MLEYIDSTWACPLCDFALWHRSFQYADCRWTQPDENRGLEFKGCNRLAAPCLSKKGS